LKEWRAVAHALREETDVSFMGVLYFAAAMDLDQKLPSRPCQVERAGSVVNRLKGADRSRPRDDHGTDEVIG
jgi:hypothetical protein